MEDEGGLAVGASLTLNVNLQICWLDPMSLLSKLLFVELRKFSPSLMSRFWGDSAQNVVAVVYWERLLYT